MGVLGRLLHGTFFFYSVVTARPGHHSKAGGTHPPQKGGDHDFDILWELRHAGIPIVLGILAFKSRLL